MIFKIIGNFDEVDFEKILNKLSTTFEFMYSDNSLFIALRNYSEKDKAKNVMKNALRPSSFFITKEITENNLGKESPTVIKWCRDNFVELDKQRFEVEQQARLKQAMVALDECERILAARKKEAFKCNGEEELNGRSKKQRKTEETN